LDPLHEAAELLDAHRLAAVFLQRPRGVAEVGAARLLDRGDDPAAPSEGDAVGDDEMPRHAALGGEDDIVPDAGAAGDAGLRDDDAVLPDQAVVADLDLVVDLGTLADHGLAEAGPV